MEINANSLSRTEFDKLVVSLCPKLYSNRFASMQSTCMCYGFDVGQGWQNLMLKLSLGLEMLINSFPEAEQANYRATQVKEKLGTLRFYLLSGTDEMYDLIDEATELSLKTCEECGEAGELMTKNGAQYGWMKTLCDNCAKAASYAVFKETEDAQ